MTLKQYETLALAWADEHVLQVTLNRPQIMNAMNTQMGIDMRDLVEIELRDNIPDVRCIILTGAGDRAFCVGGDLKERKGMTDATWQKQHVIFEDAVFGITDLNVPTIAAVNGLALGGGCEIALACDFIYAAETARFALPEIKLGIFPGSGGTLHFPRAVGERRAKEVILTGDQFSSQEGEAWGMVNKVCPDDKLLEMTLQAANKIAGNGPLAVRAARQSIHCGLQMDLTNAIKQSLQLYNHTAKSKDRLEGVLAFNEKRKPNFIGE